MFLFHLTNRKAGSQDLSTADELRAVHMLVEMSIHQSLSSSGLESKAGTLYPVTALNIASEIEEVRIKFSCWDPVVHSPSRCL